MIARLLSVQQIHDWLAKAKYGVLKFVRVQDEYRFAVVLDGPEHKDMLNKDETVTSAGFIVIGEDKSVTAKGESMSLRIGIAKDDSDNIKNLLFGENNVCAVVSG